MSSDVKGLDPILDAIEHFSHKPDHYMAETKWQSIKISNLSFYHSRQNASNITLKKIELMIQRGDKIALIGESGSGKSTYRIKKLSRF